MLQFITKYPAERTIADQVKGVVEGGCRWIELSAPGMGINELREIAMEIIPVCKEADAFVIMRDHTDLAAELRLHGIFMDYEGNPRAVREKMGGEAVIGVAVTDFDQIFNLRSADVDYLVLNLRDTTTRDKTVAAVVMAREKGVKLPIVAEGEFSIEEMRSLLEAGFSGIALSAALADAPDIKGATEYVLESLRDQ